MAAHIIIGAVATNDFWVKVLLVIRENLRHESGTCQTDFQKTISDRFEPCAFT